MSAAPIEPTAASEARADEGATADHGALDRALVSGIAWTGGLRWASQIFSWVGTLVLARLLNPADFGILAMAGVYIGMVSLVNEMGLTASIVQHREITNDDIAGLGGLSVAVGLCFAGLSVALARSIAAFYRAPAVAGVVAVLSLSFLVSSLQVVPRAMMQRELRFRSLAALNAGRAIAATILTVALALAGLTYWSLVLGNLLANVLETVALNLARPHPIRLPRPLAPLRELITFGGHVVGARAAWYVYENADFAVVGRVLGKAILGSYGLAWDLAGQPVEKVSVIVMRVTPAVFAAVQDDAAALRRYLAALLEGISLVTFPLAFGLMLTAGDLVPVLLGPKWHAAILPLQLLAGFAGFRSVSTLFAQILIAKGRARLTMQFNILAAIVLPLAFLAGTHWGVGGVAAAWIVVYPVLLVVFYIRYCLGLIDMRWTELSAALWPASSASAVMIGAVGAVQASLAGVGAPTRLAIEVAVGALSYAAIVRWVHGDRVRAYRRLLAELRK